MKFASLNPRTRIALDFGTDRLLASQSNRDPIRPAILAAGTVGSSIFHADPSLGEAASTQEGDELRRMLRAAGFRGRECALTLPSSAFLCELAELPSSTDRELQESAAWEAVDHFGIEREELVTRTLPLATMSLAGNASPFLIVALRTSTALYASDVVAAAGLEPVRLEHAALAAIRTIWRRERVQSGSGQIAALHVEDAWATLAVLNRGGLVVFHSFAIHGASSASARSAAGKDLFASPAGSIPLAGDASSDADLSWHPFAEQVLTYLRHMERQRPGSWPERLVATGPGAARAGLLNAIESLCGINSTLTCPSREFALGPLAGEDGNLFAWASCLGSLLVDVPQAAAALQETMS
ncbi:MAG: hypothetical protein O2819_00940 [Planctomycetota bacterium]|nr:hypothetical protein [Planctomycetota bacterium]